MVLLGLVATILIFGAAQSQPKSKPQNKPSELSVQQSPTQPTPTAQNLSPEQITKAITDGLITALKEYETHHPALPPDNSSWYFNLFLIAFTACLVVVGAIQCYIIFWTLKATETAANAAALQARAAVGAELAELVIHRIDLVPFPDATPGQQDFAIAAGPLAPNEMRAVVHVTNSGRTRSRINQICVEWIVVERNSPTKNPDPPVVPVYQNQIGTSHIFGENQTIPLKWSGGTNSIIRLTTVQRTAINNNTAWLWVYGVIRYVDFLRETYDIGFCAHWEAVAGSTISDFGPVSTNSPRGFVMEGPPPYIYRKKQKAIT